jgi:hypothetical protein
MKAILFSVFLVFGSFARAHPVPENPLWLTYPGGDGPGKGRHIILIAADQEYRSEQAMPMLAKILATHHGFDCTVLFGVNGRGEVDPTMPVYPEKGRESEFKEHHIPGLEHLASADLVVFFSRLLTLPKSEMEHIVKYVDSGKPIIALRTANHGFHVPLPYKLNGREVRWGEDVLGGTFLNHHGQWMADSTRGRIVPEQKQHPVLTGVTDIWGNSDVYRTYPEGASLPALDISSTSRPCGVVRSWRKRTWRMSASARSRQRVPARGNMETARVPLAREVPGRPLSGRHFTWTVSSSRVACPYAARSSSAARRTRCCRSWRRRC